MMSIGAAHERPRRSAANPRGFEAGRSQREKPGRRLGLTWTQVRSPEGVFTGIEVTSEPLAAHGD
jgi:hypothetical protein